MPPLQKFPYSTFSIKILWLDKKISEIKKTPEPNNKIWKIKYVK